MSHRKDRVELQKCIAVCGGVLAPLVLPILLGRILGSSRWMALRSEGFEMALAVGIGLLGGEASVAIYPAARKTRIWLMVVYAVIVYPALIIALLWFLLEVLKIKIA